MSAQIDIAFRDRDIRRRGGAGEAVQSLAESFGISEARVRKILSRAAGRRRKRYRPDITAEKLHEMNRGGMTGKQIAECLGVTAEFVRNRAWEVAPLIAHRCRGIKMSDADAAAVRVAISRGEKLEDIAARFGVTKGMVSHLKHGRKRARELAGWTPEFRAWVAANSRADSKIRLAERSNTKEDSARSP